MFPGSIGYQELVIIAVVAVILFGGRLPDVARSLGQSYEQFRKGLSDLQSTFKEDAYTTSDDHLKSLPDYSDVDEIEEPTGGQFEPPTDDEEKE